MTITFTVPSIPIAQPRQRHAVRSFGGKSVAVNYTPSAHPVTAFKATVRLALNAAYKGPPLQGPITLKAWFVFPRPQNMIWKKRDMLREHHAKKPDLDNCLKSLKDSLGGMAWNDDAQVSEIQAWKSIAAGDEQPHVWVEISEAKLS